MKKKLVVAMAMMSIAGMTIVGCGQQSNVATPKVATSRGVESTVSAGVVTNQTNGEEAATAVATATNTEMFTDNDLDSSYDQASATKITLADGNIKVEGSGATAKDNQLVISEEGTYIVSGTLKDGQIVVDAVNTAKIKIVLNGAKISSSSSGAIYVKQADKVFFILEGDTTLATTGEFVQTDENTVDGVIFSKEDITFNGNGSLSIETKYGHGIVSKDDLVIAAGTYTIATSDHGLSGKDSVRIADGTIDITSGTDGLHSENEEDTSLGFTYIGGGNITIKAKDDGIHAESTFTLENGKVDIQESLEGIEGQYVYFKGGTLNLVASDDGLNATAPSTTASGGMGGMDATVDAGIYISGGELKIDASGDGLDSNGNIEVTGGTTYVSGPTNNGNGGMDYNGSATVEGGTIIVTGSSGMAQNFTSGSQGVALVNVGSQNAGTKLTLKDSSGNELATFTPNKGYETVVISTKGMEVGQTYTLDAGSSSTTITLDSLVSGAGMGGGPRGQMNGNQQGMPPQGRDSNQGMMPQERGNQQGMPPQQGGSQQGMPPQGRDSNQGMMPQERGNQQGMPPQQGGNQQGMPPQKNSQQANPSRGSNLQERRDGQSSASPKKNNQLQKDTSIKERNSQSKNTTTGEKQVKTRQTNK